MSKSLLLSGCLFVSLGYARPGALEGLTLPLTFERMGEAGTARYLARNGSYSVEASKDNIAIRLRGTADDIRLEPVAGKLRVPEAGERLATVSHYFVGTTRLTNVPHFDSVYFRDVWPGIDVRLHGSGDNLEYDLLVAPGGDVTRAVFRVKGASGVAIEDSGAVRISSGKAFFRQRPAVAFQGSEKVRVRSVVRGETIGFEVGAYDRGRPLLIDPVIEAATLTGNNGTNPAPVFSAHTDGSFYVAGVLEAASPGPVAAAPSGFRTTLAGGADVFVARIAADAKSVLYYTYLGGAADETLNAITVDGSGNVVIAGSTKSANFPVSNAAQGALNAPVLPVNTDAFVTKLNSTGNQLVFSTYLGSPGADAAMALAVDALGNVVVAGETSAAGFPTTAGAYRTTLAGGKDAWVAKLPAAGGALLASTYLGSAGEETVAAVAVDAAGSMYVGGDTDSTAFPVTAGAAIVSTSVASNGFVTKFTGTGNALVYSTFVGGNSRDSIHDLKLDGSGNAYLTGWTESQDFPVSSGAYQTWVLGRTGFLSKLNANGTAFGYSTYFGAVSMADRSRLAVESNGVVYLAGASYTGPVPIIGTQIMPAADPQNTQSVSFVTRFTTAGVPDQSMSYYAPDLQNMIHSLRAATPRSLTLVAPGVVVVGGLVQGLQFPTTPGAVASGVPTYPNWAPYVMRLSYQSTCTVSLNPTVMNFSNLAGSSVATVTPQAGCTWAAGTGGAWAVPSVENASQVRITVPYSNGPARTATVLVGGQPLTVNQASGCYWIFTPSSLTVPNYGGNLNSTMDNGYGCPWSLTSNVNWIEVPSTLYYAPGNIPGKVRVNYSPQARTGVVSSAGGSQLTVQQTGNSCTYSLPVPSMQLPYTFVNTAVIQVNTADGCPWDIVGQPDWISLSSGGTDSGPRSIQLLASGNDGPARSATMKIANLDFTLSQAAHPQWGTWALTVIDGANQATAPLTAFATPLKVRLLIAGVPANQTTVNFDAPQSGPSVVFPNSTANQSVLTDSNGYATAPAMIANAIEGSFSITATAQFGATATIPLRIVKASSVVSPPPGTTLYGATAQFTWAPSSAALDYWLDIGTTAGQGNLFGGAISGTGHLANGLPCNGLPVHVQLYTRSASGYSAPQRVTYTANTNCAADPRATLQTPAAGSAAGPSLALSWSTGTGAVSYTVEAGSGLGLNDIYTATITAQTLNIDGIACNGSPLFVRLFTRTAAGLQPPHDYTFGRPQGCSAATRAVLLTPAPKTRLGGSDITFTWGPVSGSSEYWLDVGSTFAQGNIFGGAVTGTSRQVTGIPCTGQPIYVRLYTKTGTQYLTPFDYVFTGAPAGCTATAQPVLTAPAPSTALAGRDVQFEWTPGSGAIEYEFSIGSSAGAADVAGGSVAGTRKYVTGIPCDGRTIHARLRMRTGSGLGPNNDFTYTAPTNCGGTNLPTAAAMTSPAAGSTLTASTVTFTWAAGNGALDYWLDVGVSPGNGGIFGGVVTGLSKQVVNIPCNGQPVYARLWTRHAGGYLPPLDYTYSAAAACAVVETRGTMVTPANGAQLAGGQVTFTWLAGSAAQEYWLDVGTQLGQGNVSAGFVSSLTKTVSGIPCNGQTIYVRLWTRVISGAWLPIDYTYTAAANCPDTQAVLTGPTQRTQLPSATTTFTWTTPSNAIDYWLDVGYSAGKGEIFGGVVTGGSKTISGLPCSVVTVVYVRLWTRTSAGYLAPLDYLFLGTGNCTSDKAVLFSPQPGSTLSQTPATFRWTTGTGVTAYWLDVGTAVGQGNMFGGEVTQDVKSVDISACGNGTLYVRLWTKVATGYLAPEDYTYQCSVTDPRAKMIRPQPGTKLSGTGVTFEWSGGTGASDYWLDVGTSQGSGNIFGGVVVSTFRTVTGIPTGSGGPIWVRLYTRIGGVWQAPIDYSYGRP